MRAHVRGIERATPSAAREETRRRRARPLVGYVVLGLVGRGGRGEVYATYDPELDRKIAFKLLRAR
jgi:eukaryotic-like serine/threonine-protein kinase